MRLSVLCFTLPIIGVLVAAVPTHGQVPIIQGTLAAGQTIVKGAGSPPVAAGPMGAVHIYVCVRAIAPAPTTSCDDTSASLVTPAGPAAFVTTDNTGAFTANLATSLIAGQYVYLTQEVPAVGATPAVTTLSVIAVQVAAAVAASVNFMQGALPPRLLQPRQGSDFVLAIPAQPPSGYTPISLTAFKTTIHKTCTETAAGLLGTASIPSPFAQGLPLSIPTAAGALVNHDTVCVAESYAPLDATQNGPIPDTLTGLIKVISGNAKGYDDLCQYAYNDCDFHILSVAGVEQSDLSSQSSQTNAFIDLIARAPTNTRFGTVGYKPAFWAPRQHPIRRTLWQRPPTRLGL